MMIHGDCSSRGCYAMTDEQIAEIFTLARESFFGGQKSFQIQAFPFRMTPLNMAKHRNSPHVAFWRMLKQGYDHFEVTRRVPKVDVCDKHYVFDAEPKSKFSPADHCPAYKVPPEIASAVLDKQQRDDVQTTELINRGTSTVPARMGMDGGMNATFLEAVKSHGGPGVTIRTASGTIPSHVNPPAPRGSTMTLASHETKPVEQVAAASSVGGDIASFWSQLFGSKKEESGAAETQTTQLTPSPSNRSTPRATKPAQTAATATPRSSEKTPSGTNKPASVPQQQETAAEPQVKAANNSNIVSGAAPTFDNRFGPPN